MCDVHQAAEIAGMVDLRVARASVKGGSGERMRPELSVSLMH
jgi:hypothetical protein